MCLARTIFFTMLASLLTELIPALTVAETGAILATGTEHCRSWWGCTDIPDNGCWDGRVNRNCDITGAPAGVVITHVTVKYDINHTYVGDLTVELSTERNGIWYGCMLWEEEGGSADDIHETETCWSEFDDLDPNGTWYLVAWDCAPADVGCIDDFEIWVHWSESNQCPNDPSNPSPANGATNVSVNANLDWSCSDPDGDVLYYTVHFGTGDPLPIIKNDQTGSYADPGTLEEGTTYYWYVVANDHNGCSAVNNTAWSFTTEANQCPNAPSNPSPVNGATDVSVNANLDWSCSDPDGDVLYYTVHFGTGDPLPIIKNDQTGSYADPGTLEEGTTYYWYVVASDHNGCAITGATVWSFTTEANQCPNAPSNPSPANGATDVSVNANLDWSCSDPDGDILYYTVYFEKNNPSPDNVIKDDQTGSSADPGTLEFDTWYYWYVTASDHNGCAITSPNVWSFKTKYNAKPTITVTQPISDVLVPVGGIVHIEWDGYDPDDDAKVFLFYDADCNPDNGGFTLVTGFAQPEDGTYDWNTDEVIPGTYRIYAFIDDEHHGIDLNMDCADGAVTVGHVSAIYEPPYIGATSRHKLQELNGWGLRAVQSSPSDYSPQSGTIHHRNISSAILGGATSVWIEDGIKWNFSVPESGNYKVTVKGRVNGEIRAAGYMGIDDYKHWLAILARVEENGNQQGIAMYELHNTLDEPVPSGIMELSLMGVKMIIGALFPGTWLTYVKDVIEIAELLEDLAETTTPVKLFNDYQFMNNDLSFVVELNANTQYVFEFCVYGATIVGTSAGFVLSTTDMAVDFTEVEIEQLGGDVVGPIIQVTPNNIVEMASTYVNEYLDFPDAFIIKNIGDLDLSGNATVASGPFTITSGSIFNLSPGEEIPLNIRFMSHDAGSYTRKITFSGGGDVERFIRCMALDADPVLAVNPQETVEFGTIETESTLELDVFVITNQGGGVLEGNASVGQPFSITSGNYYSLSEGELQVVKIRFSPSENGDFTKSVNLSGGLGATRTVHGIASPSVDVEEIDSPETPETFSLAQNYPNPFNPETRIEFSLPRASFVTIDVFDILGKRITRLVQERLSAGHKIVTWDGRDDNGQSISSGIYFYRIVADDFSESKKMILLK